MGFSYLNVAYREPARNARGSRSRFQTWHPRDSITVQLCAWHPSSQCNNAKRGTHGKCGRVYEAPMHARGTHACGTDEAVESTDRDCRRAHRRDRRGHRVRALRACGHPTDRCARKPTEAPDDRLGGHGRQGGRGQALVRTRRRGLVAGELWRAHSRTPLAAGDQAIVVAVSNLTLRVEPVARSFE